MQLHKVQGAEYTFSSVKHFVFGDEQGESLSMWDCLLGQTPSLGLGVRQAGDIANLENIDVDE